MYESETVNGIFLMEGVDSVGVDLKSLEFGRIELVHAVTEFAGEITELIKKYEGFECSGVLEYEVIYPLGIWIAESIKENVYFPPADEFKLISASRLNEFFETDKNQVREVEDETDVIICRSDLKVGEKVHYKSSYRADSRSTSPIDRFENGIVKEIPEHTAGAVRVVYNCAGNWDDYQNYTSALTNLRDLKKGWK